MDPVNTSPVEMDASGEIRQGHLTIRKEACLFDVGRRNATIVVACDNPDFPRAIEELQGPETRMFACGFAISQGVADACVNSTVRYYPVNEDGTKLEKVADEHGRPLNPRHPKMQVHHYRADVKVQRAGAGR